MQKIILDEDRLDLAKLFKGVGVEVGVASGYYSGKIMELGQVVKMYGVDPYERHKGYVDYTKDSTFSTIRAAAHKLLGDNPRYEFMEMYSDEAADYFADESLDFVYIDGDHSYEAVMEDIEAWVPKVKKGGILAGDDYIKSNRDKQYYDVIRAVDEYAEKHNLDLYLYHRGRNPTNWMFRKP